MRKVKRFVETVSAYGGEATTTEIREVTNLSRSSYQHFYDKLFEFDIIDHETARVDGGRMKVAILTEKGQDMLNKKVFARWIDQHTTDTPDPDEFDDEVLELRARVAELERVVEDLQAEVGVRDV
jgi:predicted transcriptional regulator